MRKSMILAIMTIALFSCEKEEGLPPGTARPKPVFPLREGNIWRCDIVSYNFYDSGKTYTTSFDTLEPAIIMNDLEYYSFFGELYTLLDMNTVQTSFRNIATWTLREYPGEYIWFAKVYKPDTMSAINFYGDVSPGKGITIAYPEETKIKGYQCLRTEILYYNDDDSYAGKKVLYFSKGFGPIYEAQYSVEHKHETNKTNIDTLKVQEKFYTPIVYRY